MVPYVDGTVSASFFRLTPRERATLMLSQIRSDAEAQHYRRWRRIGAVSQAGIVAIEAALLAFTGVVLPTLAAIFVVALFLTFEVVMQYRTRGGLRRVVRVCETTADTA
ncbi:hypothetical protein [Mycobacteroides abscessus]|uniref:hypothetical protein n=1 Tax=Mycobacteroides abscessus TaxID=36809 RepID=UPI000699059D|nr:hypothetical protein [Mycobacteroides abscessus]